MSMRSLETAILHEARQVLCNRNLRLKDLVEWSTGTPVSREGEVSVPLVFHSGVTIVVANGMDKRPTQALAEKEG